MRVCTTVIRDCRKKLTSGHRIVEYATREQAQQAVNTLSNQNLMGRLVYVREVCDQPGRSVELRVSSRPFKLTCLATC